MRPLRVLGAVLALAVLVAAGVEAGSDLRTGLVVCTATRSHLVAAYPNRQDLLVQNVGTLHVNVGRGTVMTTLHVGSSLSLDDYQGGIECQTQPGTGGTAVEWFEVIK